MAKLQDGNSDIRAGINIVLNALEAPARQIAENAERRGSIRCWQGQRQQVGSLRFRCADEEYGDILQAGARD